MNVELRTATHARTRADSKENRVHLGLTSLCALAAVVGIITGCGAWLFRAMISFVHNLFFLGVISIHYDSSQFTPAHPWGAAVILVPVVGGAIVTFIVSNFAPEAKGHGVPEVMDAIYYKGGVIRPVVAAVKSVASAVAIGTGSAVGREGPIIQIGSALGSTFGQIIKLSPGQRITLVAAGAGAGIAATFNTPLGGVLFVTELMLPEVSVNTFLPVATATGIATFLGRLFFGPDPAFFVPNVTPLPNHLGAGAFTLVLYVVLGVLTGVAAAAFTRGLHLAEDLFDKISGRYLRHMFGMLLVGILIYLLYRNFGHYYVEGVGYATIQGILNGQLPGAELLALLFVCKLLATTTSLGSGSSGGVFSPSLYMGATLGGGFASAAVAGPARSRQYSGLCDSRHGRHGRRRDRRGHDRGDDDLRNDARLRHRAADDPRRRCESCNPAAPVPRKYLYSETGAPRSSGTARPAREYVPRAESCRRHGNRRSDRACGNEAR